MSDDFILTPGYLKPSTTPPPVFDITFIPPPKKATRIVETDTDIRYYNEFQGEEYCYLVMAKWDKDNLFPPFPLLDTV